MGCILKEVSIPENEPPHLQFQFSDPVEKSFKWMLILGRFIGVSPIHVSMKSSGGNLTFRWRSFPAIHTLLLSLLLFVIFATQIWKYVIGIGTRSNILEEMSDLHMPMYRTSITVIFIYWLRNAPRLLCLLQTWVKTSKTLNFSTKDDKFPRFCLAISILLFGTCCAENVLSDFYYIKRGGPSMEKSSLLEKLYMHNLPSLSNYLPHFSCPITLAFVIGERFSIYAFNFSDIFVMGLCRALTYKFHQINEELQLSLRELQKESQNLEGKINFSDSRPEQSLQICIIDRNESSIKVETFWKGVQSRILLLCCLAEEVASFVSPLILVCYTYSIFFIILNSLRFLYESNTGTSPYVYASTCQFGMRMILVTYHASEVYHSTELLVKSLDRDPQPISTYSHSHTAYRIERMLGRHPVGVIILGIVPITRKIFISILSLLFTAEIVLLQAMSAGNSSASRGEDGNKLDSAKCNST